MFKKLLSSVVISLTIAATYVLWRGTPTVVTPEIAPNIIEANKLALVTVTVRIQDPAFSVYGVDLVRVDAHAAVLSEIEMIDKDGNQCRRSS